MNEPKPPFDWDTLGEDPLPGEMDDEALLQAVLAGDLGAPATNIEPSRRRWVRPIVAVAVLVAAAVVLMLAAPQWTEALLGVDNDGTMAPILEADPEPEHRYGAAPVPPAAPPSTPAASEPPPQPEEPAEDAAEVPDPPEPSPEPPRRRTPTPTADALLLEAQDAMAAKDNAEAIRTYGALVRTHPRSPQARAARLSLGRLELAAGHPKRALRHYDAYLAGAGGGLRREAELGRIDALRKLGRTDAERSAIEAFLSAHPGTVHANRLKSRLEALR